MNGMFGILIKLNIEEVRLNIMAKSNFIHILQIPFILNIPVQTIHTKTNPDAVAPGFVFAQKITIFLRMFMHIISKHHCIIENIYQHRL